MNLDLRLYRLNAGGGGGGALPYKIYSAFLTQSGTNAPVATVVQNTFGGVLVWTRDGIGSYTVTLLNAFTNGKTSIMFSIRKQQSGGFTKAFYYGGFTDINSLFTGTIDSVGGESESDNMYDKSFIEIRVYP